MKDEYEPIRSFFFVMDHVLEEKESHRHFSFFLFLFDRTNILHIMPTKNSQKNNNQIPRIDIVLLIVGTRGDVQPFVA